MVQSVISQSVPTPSTPPKPKRRLLLRGESLVGFAGLALAGTILSTLTAAGVLTIRQQQAQVAATRQAQLSSLTNLLSESATALLANNDYTGVRRLLVDSKASAELATCRIELLDGAVLADAQPSKINLAAPPAVWPTGPLDALVAADDETTIRFVQTLNVPGHGRANLLVTAARVTAANATSSVISTLGLVGAIGLLISWGIYRHIRRRVRTLGLIRDALLAADHKQINRDALGLCADHGPEAVAWNRLLEENQALQSSASAERVKTVLGDRREGRGDLEHACDALSVGMIVMDENRTIKLVNGAAAAMLASQRSNMIGKPVAEIIDDEQVAATLASIGNSPQRKVLEVQRKAERGGGTLRINIRPLRRDDAGTALITLEDVTQQRIADQARNNFVSQAAHELRTPLTNMRLCLEDALEGTESDPTMIREQFNMLNTEARRLERIVGEMLSVSEIEAGSLQIKQDDVRLDKLFEELQNDYRSQAATKHLTLNFQLPPKYPILLGDRDKLMLVMHNLLGNAVKYTPAGGTVTLAVRSNGSNLVVDFTDTGIGISTEDQAKLFTKFYRAKDTRVSKIVGTGLGLALAREVARLHGGDVTLQSELDKGSTFTLSLPLQTNSQAKAA